LCIVFEHVESHRDLLNVSLVCRSWRVVSMRNRMWIRFFRNKELSIQMNNINLLILDLEETERKKKEQRKYEYDLHQRIYQLDERIGLLIDHKKKIKSPRSSLVTKCKSEDYLSSRTKMNDESEEYPASSEFEALKKRAEIIMSIICIFRHIAESEHALEGIQNSYNVFSYLHKSAVRTWPKFLLNADQIFAFVKMCDKKRVEKNTGFCRIIFAEIMQFVEQCQNRHSWSCGELDELNCSTVTLRVQLERYDNYIKHILDQYSHISKQTEVRFKLRDLEKKGVLVSSPVEPHLRKATSFAISYLPVGIFQLMVLKSGKQADVIMLNLADILEKLHHNISALNYEDYLLNTKNTLELLEKHVLRIK